MTIFLEFILLLSILWYGRKALKPRDLETTEQKQKAWFAQGAAARRIGLGPDDNPYDQYSESMAHTFWADGNDAELEFQRNKVASLKVV
ncbi:MAG TPA: hypothetical protein VG892_07625 [Terriglobales bacterium]|nr:hypothetical protein [Terriglobales bacterium]